MSVDRERSRDREGMVVRHQHSFDITSSRIPMWDSSDPDRAPPPLPLNPGSPNLARPQSTSATIAAAAQALTEKARENLAPSPYVSNPMPEKSPERALVKGAAHRRLQSLQPSNVRDLRSYLDGVRSPERSPERMPARGVTPALESHKDRDYFAGSPEKNSSRTGTPTTPSRDPLTHTPSVRPTSKATHKPILGENTPPSATMLALQTMAAKEFPDTPLSSITSGQTPRPSSTTSFEPISQQILSLTTICTNLQKEMAQLSRRSKDNATDLISLKEATNARDEDIRKSLRELLSSVNTQSTSNTGILGGNSASRGGSALGVNQTTPQSQKNIQLPRIPSPSLFDRQERVGSPSLYSLDGAPSLAMLEKIIREMVTKDGQERLLGNLSTLLDKASKESGETAKKVTELVQFIKESQNQAIVTRGVENGGTTKSIEDGTPELQAGPLMKATRELQLTNISTAAGAENRKPYSSPKAADFVGDEMIKLLKKIKDSVFQTGGLVGEVKAQQRDLRGEVMGMGRELARKIDEFHKPATGAKAIEDGSGKQDIARIIQEGLADLKVHLDEAMREKRRQSTSTIVSRTSVDSREVRDVVKYELANLTKGHAVNATIDKEAILDAVKEAYEAYRPEIELQQFGLERDEILQCLKEGLEDYRDNAHQPTGVTREELLETIHEAMQNFNPPPPVNDSHEIREEVLSAVRGCLDEIKPSLAVQRSIPGFQNERELDATREVVLDAVRSGLASHGPNATRELEISRDDLFDAVKAGLEASGTPFGRYGEQVVNQLHDLVQDMKSEFKSYSTASGRDTEQVLDALKDGLEDLRVEIEQYVDHAQDVTGKDEIIDTIRVGLEHLRSETERYCAAGPQGDHAFSPADMLAYMKTEFEHLHETVSQLAANSDRLSDKAAILTAMHAGFESLKANVSNRGFDSDEIDEAMKVEFEQLRDAISSASASQRDEIIDVVQTGFDALRAQLDQGAISVNTTDAVIRAIKDELDPIKETLTSTMVRSSSGGDSEDIIDAIRENLDGMRTHMIAEQQTKAEETLATIQGEFEHLRNTIGSAVLAPSVADGKDEILEVLQNMADGLRKHVSAEQKESSRVLSDEIDNLRNSLGSSIVQAGPASSKDDILESLHNAVDAIRAAGANGGVGEGLLVAIRGEFEVLRSNLTRCASKADSEEILEAVRLGMDDLRSHLEKKIENPEPQMKVTGEILDALNDGLDSLKTDVQKMIDKPMDMTVSYEILDTLKQGLDDIRSDISRLRGVKRRESRERGLLVGNEIVLAEDSEDNTSSHGNTKAADNTDNLRRDDLERLEVMLAQLQVKVETVDANIQNPVFPLEPTKSTQKADLTSIEEMLKDLQATITIMAARELDTELVAKKSDTDAIETLLRNTRAQLEEIQLANATAALSQDHVEAIDSHFKQAREAIDDLSARIDESNASSKADIAVVEILVQELKTAIEQMKEDVKKPAITDGEDGPISKNDVDILGVLAIEIRDKLAELKLPDAESLPSKADVEQLTGLIHDFRDSHDKLKDSYETDIGITAKAFDDRKKEAEDIITAIGIMRSGMADIRDELKAKIEVSAEDLSGLNDNMKSLEETIGSNFNITADVKELMEIVNREFDRVHGTVDDLKAVQEQKATEAGEKFEESKASVVADISAKLDDKFDVIMSKYDDAQKSAEEQVRSMAEKAAEQAAILSTTKEVAEDLKISLDTLGTTVTAMETTFTEISSKISGDTQTVFARIDDGFNKLEDVHTTALAKQEHHMTRNELSKVLSVVEGVRGHLSDHNPKVMTTLQEVLSLLNQTYQQSQKAQNIAEEHARAAAEQSRSITNELKDSLPALLPAPAPAIEAAPEYDDSEIRDKLDQLMEQMKASENASSQLERLDKIHAQVMATAAEVSEFVTTQTRLITEGHESREKEAKEIETLIERRIIERERIDDDIHVLTSEKEELLATIAALRSERDNLASHKSRLAADVSSLETALQIRKEELHAMDIKADALERRIIEGLMNHSRALLLTKNDANQAPPQPRMRHPSDASHSTMGPLPPSSAVSQGLNLALKQRASPARRSGFQPNSNPTGRRILSLNQISHNTPTGGHGYLASSGTAASKQASFLKRSQSVRQPGARKISWGGDGKRDRRSISTADIEENKENGDVDRSLHDLSEDDGESYNGHSCDDAYSEAGTERRHSIVSSRTANSHAMAGEHPGSKLDVAAPERRASDGTVTGSEYTATGSYITGTGSYLTGTGSYITGSEIDGRTSFGSTVRSTLGVESAVDEGHDEDYASHDDEEAENDDAVAGAQANPDQRHDLAVEAYNVAGIDALEKDLVVYAPPSDSGLGTDLPTAAFSGSETEYFRHATDGQASSVGGL